MADIPQTFNEWAAHNSVNPLQRQIINVMIEDRDLLGRVPILPWPGGEDWSWTLNKTLPTFTFGAETAAHESTQALRRKMRTYLSYGHGDISVPIHSSSTLFAAQNMEAEDSMDLIRSAGIAVSDKLWTGDYVTEANVSITGTGIAATPYVDAVVNVSMNMPSGRCDLHYTHVGTFVKFKAPGSTTWGTPVACAGDGDHILTDGDDPTMAVTLTLDVSDLGADTAMHGALTIQQPENIAGLHGLAQLDSAQILTVGTNGEAATLAQLDNLEEACIGPKEEKYFLVSKRTRIAIKHLIGGVGGMKQREFQQARDLSKYDLVYEGVPVLADTGIDTTETQGAASGTCARMYCVRLNSKVGYHLFAGSHHGPNEGTMNAASDHSIAGDGSGGLMQLPLYMRRLPEGEDNQNFKWRASIAIAAVLKRSKSLSMKYGVTT